MWCWTTTLLLAALASAQTFDVASLKPSGPHSGNRIEGGPGTSDPGRYRYTSATLEDLIVTAYDVEYFQVSSKIRIDRDCFDLTATIPPGVTKEQFRIMLQNLLSERFQLKLHRETREFSGYALVVAKSGLRLSGGTSTAADFPEIPDGKPGIRTMETTRGGHFLVRERVQQMSMAAVARSLQVPGNLPVVDQTGLTGKFDFTLEYAYPGHAAQDLPETPPASTVFTVFTAVQSLGLQLVSRRVPFHVLVIDSFRAAPLEN